MVLIAIIAVGTTGMSSAFADSSTGPFSPQQTNQFGGTCGTNLTNTSDYSCAVAYSTGYMYPLTKVYSGSGNTENSEIRLNAEQVGTYSVGSSPYITTSESTVTFTSYWDLEGDIQKTIGNQWAWLDYGHEIYKQNWWGGWDEVDQCTERKTSSFDNTETVSCVIANSGENTYRIGGYVYAIAQNIYPEGDIAYVDFYTGNNHAQITQLSITD